MLKLMSLVLIALFLLPMSLCFVRNNRITFTYKITTRPRHTMRTRTVRRTTPLGQILYNKAPVDQWMREYFKKPIDEFSLLPPLEKIDNCNECPRIHMPVCATNKITYTNLCWMNCFNKLANKDVKLLHVGKCYVWLDDFYDPVD